jgi:hypothetical protein
VIFVGYDPRPKKQFAELRLTVIFVGYDLRPPPKKKSLVTETVFSARSRAEPEKKKPASIIDCKYSVSITGKDVLVAATFPVNGIFCAR